MCSSHAQLHRTSRKREIFPPNSDFPVYSEAGSMPSRASCSLRKLSAIPWWLIQSVRLHRSKSSSGAINLPTSCDAINFHFPLSVTTQFFMCEMIFDWLKAVENDFPLRERGFPVGSLVHARVHVFFTFATSRSLADPLVCDENKTLSNVRRWILIRRALGVPLLFI